MAARTLASIALGSGPGARPESTERVLRTVQPRSVRPHLRAMLVVAAPPRARAEPRAWEVAIGADQRRRWRVLLADGYISVPAGGSSVTSIHRHHIVRWADGHGWRLARVVEEPVPAEPGDRRAGLGQAVERVESRESDGLVVARMKSIGSSLEEALDAIERIQAAGGRFVSVCDGVDLGTRDGQLALRLLVSVARW
jgi:hypothetical protein